MNKNIVTHILTAEQIDINKLVIFVKEYTFNKLNREITANEISSIIQAIQMGILDIRYAAKQAALVLNLYVMEVFNKNGYLVKTFVYE